MKIQQLVPQPREGLKHSQKLKSKRLAFWWRRNRAESNQMTEDKSSLTKMAKERTWTISWRIRIALIILRSHKRGVLHSALSERGEPISTWIMPYLTRMDILRGMAKRTSRTLKNLRKVNLVQSWTRIRIIIATKSRRTNCCRKEPFSNLQCLQRNSSFHFQKAMAKPKVKLGDTRLLSPYRYLSQIKMNLKLWMQIRRAWSKQSN